jgi:tetratricopeptide (TPR) repeat protein
LALFREAGDPRGTAAALYDVARLAARRREWAEAERALDESLALTQQTNDDYLAAYLYNIWALIANEQGRIDEAQAHYALALAAARRSENKAGIALILTAHGELARQQGDFAQAEAHYLEAMGIAHELSQKARVVMLLHNLGHVALHKQDTRRAEATFRECIRLGMELPDMENFGICIVGLGGVAALEGKPGQAAFLVGVGEMVLETIGAQLLAADREAYEGYVVRARALLPEEEFETQRRAGRSLTIPAAEALILGSGG